MEKEEEKKFLFSSNSKRGLSTVVATLLIILLVLVAVGIIWVVVRNVIQKGAEEIELGQFSFDLSIKSAYIEGSNVKVSVRRSSGEGEMVGVKFIFSDNLNSFIADRDVPLESLEVRTFTFNSTEVGGIETVQIVSVAPIYKLESGSEKTGSVTDTATISSSGSGDEVGDPYTGYCGDSIIQIPNGDGESEICDGTNLGGETCLSLGFLGGDLFCSSDCLSLNTSSCDAGLPASCDGSWNPPEDEDVECDGGSNCGSDCNCLAGFTANGAGGCDLNPPINNGTIYSVWPTGAVKYFDSEDLPVDVSEYNSYYVNFSDSVENGCFRITWAEYLETNGRSYIRTEYIVNISAGEKYYIWEAGNCGT